MRTIMLYQTNPHSPGNGMIFIYENKKEAIDNIIRLLCYDKFKYSQGAEAEEMIRERLEKTNYFDACEVTFELFQTSIIPDKYLHL